MGVKYNRPDFREYATSHRESGGGRFQGRSRPRKKPPFAMIYAGLFLFASLGLMVSRMATIDWRAAGEMRARAEVIERSEPAATGEIVLNLRVMPVDEDPFETAFTLPERGEFAPAVGDEVGVTYVYRSASDTYVVHSLYPLTAREESVSPDLAEPDQPLFENIPLSQP